VHVALVVDRFTKAGGQERAFCAFVEGLASRHRLTVIAAAAEAAFPSGVRFERVGCARGPEVLRFWSFVRAAERVGRRGGFDVIHGIGANCAIANVVHLQTVNREKYALLGTPAAAKLGLIRGGAFRAYLHQVDRAERRALGRVGPLYVAVSARVGEEAVKWFEVKREDLRLLPNGYDPAVFSAEHARAARPEARARLGLGEDELAVLFVGPDHERKGLTTLLEAFARIRSTSARLLVAGGAQASQRLYAARAETLGVGGKVIFLPHTPDLLPAYAAADIFVLPTRYDPFGMVVIEAMACGVPTIVSACAGITEYLAEAEYARIADPLDPGEVAAQLVALAKNPSRRQAIAGAGLARAREFTWSKIVPRLESIYDEAMARKQTVPRRTPVR